MEAVPGVWCVPCRSGSQPARYLFTQELQVSSLPHINTEQNRCCWGAPPLGTIRLDVFVRTETRLNGAAIVLQATLSAEFGQHPTN